MDLEEANLSTKVKITKLEAKYCSLKVEETYKDVAHYEALVEALMVADKEKGKDLSF